ncbi:hypothetical protein ACFVQB_19475 [Paenibacillus sp. NPDC057886]|uniref:hypothetical protein n=1 Tax=Paenibacillus sp. NPDC057886 TaxID=3346270 RepID=UPI003691EBB8
MQFRSELPIVDLTFWIQGNIEILHAGTQEQIISGLGDLTFGKEEQLVMTYLQGEPIIICDVRLAPTLFDELMDELALTRYDFATILGGQMNRTFHRLLLPKAQSILQDVRSHSFIGAMRKMFLEGITLELLALCFQYALLEEEVLPGAQ